MLQNAEYKQALQEAEAEACAAAGAAAYMIVASLMRGRMAVPQGNAAQLANADFNQHKWLREEFKPRYQLPRQPVHVMIGVCAGTWKK